MRHRKLSHLWLTVLVAAMMAGFSASGLREVPAQRAPEQGASAREVPVERFNSLGDTPDAATLGVAHASATLLRILQDSPTTTDPLVFDRGGTVMTPPKLDNDKRRNQPQIRIDRNLGTARDGLATDMPNELQLNASAPSGTEAQFCVVDLSLRFTQLSPLIDGDLTAAGALTALLDGPANSITASEVFVRPDAYFSSKSVAGFESYNSSSLHRDYERGKYMFAVSDTTVRAASAQDISKVMDGLSAAVECIARGFADRSEQVGRPASNEEVMATLCSGCIVTGSVTFPSRTDLQVITALGIDVMNRAAAVAVVDQEGRVLWSYSTAEWSELEPIGELGDQTGNVFVRYNPGRYDGVVILGVLDGTVHTFDSLPENGSYFGRFYNAGVLDVDGDGLLDVAVHQGFCENSCANDEVFRWDGSSYMNG